MKVYKCFEGNNDLILLAMPKSKDKFLGIVYAFNWWGGRYELSPAMPRKTYTQSKLDEMECLGETNKEYYFNMGSSFSSSWLERKIPITSDLPQQEGQSLAYGGSTYNIQVIREQNGSVHLEINDRSL